MVRSITSPSIEAKTQALGDRITQYLCAQLANTDGVHGKVRVRVRPVLRQGLPRIQIMLILLVDLIALGEHRLASEGDEAEHRRFVKIASMVNRPTAVALSEIAGDTHIPHEIGDPHATVARYLADDLEQLRSSWAMLVERIAPLFVEDLASIERDLPALEKQAVVTAKPFWRRMFGAVIQERAA